MMSDPLARTSSNTGHQYEFGEYDGLVDLDALLHGAQAGSPTPNISCLTGSDGNGEYANYVSLQGDTSHDAGPTPTPQGRSPARRANRNPGRASASSTDNYPGLHGSNVSVPPSTGGYAIGMDDLDITTTVTPTPTATTTVSHATPTYNAPGSRSGGRKRGDSAAANRNANTNTRNGSAAGTPRNGSADSGVHLPVITPAQQRRPTETLLPSRVRVSPLTQDSSSNNTTTAATTNANANNHLGGGSYIPSHSGGRGAMTVPSTAHGARPGGAKTVMSANNLAALQHGSNNNNTATMHTTTNTLAGGIGADRTHTGVSSTGTSTNKVPPFLAPPLSPLRTRANPPLVINTTTAAPLSTAATSASASGGPTTTTATRPVTDGSVKRGESADAPQPATHAGLVDMTSPMRRSNGWVKEEVRRIDSHSQDMGAAFPQERLRQSATNSASATASVDTNHTNTVRGSSSEGHVNAGGSANASVAGRAKVNTSPAPIGTRAPGWSNDYELGRADLVGCSTADFGAMPKVNAPPLPQRVRKASAGVDAAAAANANAKKAAVFRPPPIRPASPPTGKVSSPVESVISPLKTVAQLTAARTNNNNNNSNNNATTATAQVPPPQPPMSVSAGKGTSATTTTVTHPAEKATPGTTTTTMTTTTLPDTTVSLSDSSMPAFAAARMAVAAIPHAGAHPATASAGEHNSAQHTPGTSNRRVMNAVDTHVATPGSSLMERKAAAAAAAAAAAGTVVTGGIGRTSAEAQHEKAGTNATIPAMPYSEDRRAALEAWAAFPVLDVTIRGQQPTAVQQRRERDFAAARPLVAQQLYQAVKGQAPQEFAGEPFEMNYDVHNVVVQLRHRNRPLMMAYPPRLPLELDMRPRLRRQRTPRSFYGKKFPHVGDAWFKNALEDARHVESPDIEAMEKREEEEFIRNGGDPAQRRNRYGQANNNNNNNHHQQQQQQQPQLNRATAEPNIEDINKNAVRMEQTPS